MQTLWKLSQDGLSASRTLDNGSFESRLVTAIDIDELTTALPADLPIPPSPAEIISTYEAAGQSQLDSIAKAWGYDSIVSAASYATSKVTKYKSDATALINWRDSFWQAAFAIEVAVQAGTQEMPATPDDFVALVLVAAPVPTRA